MNHFVQKGDRSTSPSANFRLDQKRGAGHIKPTRRLSEVREVWVSYDETPSWIYVEELAQQRAEMFDNCGTISPQWFEGNLHIGSME